MVLFYQYQGIVTEEFEMFQVGPKIYVYFKLWVEKSQNWKKTGVEIDETIDKKSAKSNVKDPILD